MSRIHIIKSQRTDVSLPQSSHLRSPLTKRGNIFNKKNIMEYWFFSPLYISIQFVQGFVVISMVLTAYIQCFSFPGKPLIKEYE